MCTSSDVQKIVSESEAKMEAKLQQSHNAIEKNISNLMGSEQEERKETKAMIEKILEQTANVDGRVTTLETWREVHQFQNSTLTKKLEDVCTTLQRLNWLLITGVVVALLNLIIR